MLHNILKKTIECSLLLLIFTLPFSKAMIEVCVVVAIIAWVIKKIVFPSEWIFSNVCVNKAIIAFVILNACTLFWSVNSALSLHAFFSKLLEQIFVFMLCVDVFSSEKSFKRLLIVMCASAMLISVDGIIQYMTGEDVLRSFSLCSDKKLVRASFNNPNSFAGWSIVMAPILFCLTLRDYKRKNIFVLIIYAAVFLLLFDLMLTDARAAWIAWFIGTVLLIAYLFKFGIIKMRKRDLLIVFIIVVIGGYVLLPMHIKERLVSLMNVHSNTKRIELWRKALYLIKESKCIGSGVNTFSFFTHQYDIFAGNEYPHNSYLHMIVEIGVIGTASFLLILTLFFRKCFAVLKEKKDVILLGFTCGIFSYIIHSFFDTHLYSMPMAILFWYVLGASVGRIRFLEGKRI